MNRRRTDNVETWMRLLDWQKGQTASERLAFQILAFEGFENIDPSHPLGGQDGKKDFLLKKGQEKWIAGVYFPRGQRKFSEIRKKFIEDFAGVDSNSAQGFAFVTNQEVKLTERHNLEELAGDIQVFLIHLERLSSILNSPRGYGVRLEFLDIEMTKEEQLSFFDNLTFLLSNQQKQIEKLLENQNRKVNKAATVVSSEVFLDQYTIGGLFPEKLLYTCNHCHFGFFVHNSKYSNYALFSVGLMKSFVTCPNCGSVEKT